MPRSTPNRGFKPQTSDLVSIRSKSLPLKSEKKKQKNCAFASSMEENNRTILILERISHLLAWSCRKRRFRASRSSCKRRYLDVFSPFLCSLGFCWEDLHKNLCVSTPHTILVEGLSFHTSWTIIQSDGHSQLVALV